MPQYSPANRITIHQNGSYARPGDGRRKKNRRSWVLFLVGMVTGALLMEGLHLCFHPNHTEDVKEQIKEVVLKSEGKYGNNPHSGALVAYPGKQINYASTFNDVNDTHLEAAQVVGLKTTPESRKSVENMKGQLVKLAGNANYVVDPLTHSVPYLCPKAAKEVEAIAQEFADILERNNLPHYQIILTSVLRTQEDVKKLQGSGNVNATSNSAHCYGTTFDIAYTRFEKADKDSRYMDEGNLCLVLAQALLNEQRAGHIYVKYEYKQACFHTTSRL